MGEKYRAIPKGYMTVGEMASKAGTTVRTLQYYDKEGILSPSALSDGGLRLYTDKDFVKLYQIQAMKCLGFTLGEIKSRMTSLHTSSDVAETLTQQANAVRGKITSLTEALDAIEKLKLEVLQMETVDWKKYKAIIELLQHGNEGYWAVKYFDDRVIDSIGNHFDEDGGAAAFNTWKQWCEEAARLHESGIPPSSEQGQAVAKTLWNMIMQVTGGDMDLFPEIMDFAKTNDSWDTEWKEKWAAAEPFVSEAFGIYLANLGNNPISEKIKEEFDKNV